MARKLNKVVGEPGTVNVSAALWDVVWDSIRTRMLVRASARERKVISELGDIHAASHSLGDAISARQACEILRVECTDTVSGLAREGEITHLGHDTYDKRSVVIRAQSVVLRKRRLYGGLLHVLHPLIIKRPTIEELQLPYPPHIHSLLS